MVVPPKEIASFKTHLVLVIISSKLSSVKSKALVKGFILDKYNISSA